MNQKGSNDKGLFLIVTAYFSCYVNLKCMEVYKGFLYLHGIRSVQDLSKGDKKRKTIVINGTIASKLEEYSKNEKVDQYDILHLALIDFFNNN